MAQREPIHAGTGEPVLLLHPFLCSQNVWNTVADDLARRAGSSRDDDVDGDDVDVLEEDPTRPMSSVAHGAWIVGQSVLAVVFGAGLFVAFDQLWKWNNIVALVLSVLVILGLVDGVRVVRKTEDIGSTLIAAMLVVLVIVYGTAAALPPLAAAALVFLTPAYFLFSLWSSARERASHGAMLGGMALG